MKEKKKPKYQIIYEDLIKDIQEQRYKVGDKIPTEKELANLYHVSIITSKKALDIASAEGFIQKKAGKGSFVRTDVPKIRQNPRKKVIALILPDIAHFHFFGLEMASRIFKLSRNEDYTLITCLSENNRENEKEILIKLEEDDVDGYIILPVHNENFNNEIFKIVMSGKPIILIDRYLHDMSCPNVVTDNTEAAYKGTSYLFKLGHKNIGILTRSIDNTSTIRDRKEGVYKAFAEKQWTVSEDMWLTDLDANFMLTGLTNPNSKTQDFKLKNLGTEGKKVERTIQVIKTFIERHPEITAYFAFEYLFYLLFAAAAEELGKRIPEDLSIICFDSSSVFERILIPVTCLKQNETLIAETAFNLLKDRLNGMEVTNNHKIPATLIPGETTAPLKPSP
ncbi:MAG: GntR family transcriptional regulator [Spirochaetia bacterium]|nr:GntR family transcriptional regulator [Spirochaetia bacterium]